MMLIETLNTGDKVYLYNKSIVIKFSGKRGVLSTSILNGGYSEEITAVFNHDAKTAPGMGCKLKAPTYKEHMEIISEELGLNHRFTTGIGTAADMKNISIVKKSYKNLVVTALVTGGIETNGGRVGDPASYIEEDSKIEILKPGTINIIVMIDGQIDSGVLTRSLVTITEAKTAAIQELLAGSNYSTGLATGSGTDGTIVYCNLESDRTYSNAGKHSKLGELIGISVKEAVKKALDLQSGLNEDNQKSILRRTKRYGINSETLWENYTSRERKKILHKLDYMNILFKIEKNENLVSYVSLILHLLDQYEWKLLSKDIVAIQCQEVLDKIFLETKVEENFDNLVETIIEKLKASINGLIEVSEVV
ncbi:adenosylcobinamide amidohydrolase [Cetobacterium sp.]|uniref:adenosylcobinamide amidohydrolase n=1 Tax=Cetobacterium sp. TaxID=2071632 RepID=UPI002FCA1295